MMQDFKHNLLQVAGSLNRLYELRQIALVDYFAIYMYLARGVIRAQPHQLLDELFYVVEGELKIITSETYVLRAGEFALVQKGTLYTSSAFRKTYVLFGQALVDSERKNGHGGRRTAQADVVVINPREIMRSLNQLFFSVSLLMVDEMILRTGWCQGEVAWHRHVNHDELLFVLDGQLEVDINSNKYVLAENEMMVIPREQVHHLRTRSQTLLLSLVHSDVSASEQMGYTS